MTRDGHVKEHPESAASGEGPRSGFNPEPHGTGVGSKARRVGASSGSLNPLSGGWSKAAPRKGTVPSLCVARWGENTPRGKRGVQESEGRPLPSPGCPGAPEVRVLLRFPASDSSAEAGGGRKAAREGAAWHLAAGHGPPRPPADLHCSRGRGRGGGGSQAASTGPSPRPDHARSSLRVPAHGPKGGSPRPVPGGVSNPLAARPPSPAERRGLT